MTAAELIDGLREFTTAEAGAAVLAVAYLVLAIRQNIFCWLAAFLSSLLYLVVFFAARLYMESLLQVFYAAMAIYGYQQWRYGGSDHEGVAISTWKPWQHLVALGVITAMSAAIGWIMSHTDAAFPFIDAFTSVAAVVSTYMVARKVLENWLYWFVIDSVSVYLYLARGLELTALLFIVYLVLIVVGFRRWWLEWRVA